LQARFQKLGWQPQADETAQTTQLRARLVEQLGRLDGAEFVAQAQVRFAKWLQQRDSIPVSLQEAILNVAARHADQATWEQIRQLAQSALNSAEKARYYHALTLVKNPQLAQQTLNLTLQPQLSALTFAALLYGSARDQHLDVSWRFLQQHRQVLFASQGERERQRMAANVLANAMDARYIAPLEQFTKAYLGSDAFQDMEITLELIRFNVTKKNRLLPQLRSFLRDLGKLEPMLPKL
jgi:aminopeptidase N